MSRFFLIIFLGISLQTVVSAQTYFNRRLTLHSINLTGYSTIEYKDKFYLTSLCFDSSNQLTTGGFLGIPGTRFSVFDKAGVLILDTFYQRSDSGGIVPYSNSMIPTGRGSLLIPTTAWDINGHVFLSIMNWDTSGKLRGIKQYEKPYCYTVQLDGNSWFVTDMKRDSAGNWVLLSTYNCGIKYVGGYTNIMLSKLDSNFNVLWHIPLDDTFSDHSGGHLIINKDNYIVSGNIRGWQRVRKNFRYQAEIFKTDTSGNVLWHWKSDPAKLTNTAMDIVQTADGGFVYCGQGDGVEIPEPNGTDAHINWYPTIDKIDSIGNPVWHQKLSSEFANNDYSNITTLKQLPNGDIIAAGQIRRGYNPQDTFSTYGTLVKLDPTGNVKWKRQYQYYDSSMIYHVNDMKQTSDGGFIMAGEALDVYYPYTDPIQQAWLLKVDSSGCTSLTDPQCHPTRVQPIPNTLGYKVYPNPAQTALYVSGPAEAATLMLTDISGRLLLQANVGAGVVSKIPLENLAAGVYFYRIVSVAGGVQVGKVVKE